MSNKIFEAMLQEIIDERFDKVSVFAPSFLDLSFPRLFGLLKLTLKGLDDHAWVSLLLLRSRVWNTLTSTSLLSIEAITVDF